MFHLATCTCLTDTIGHWVCAKNGWFKQQTSYFIQSKQADFKCIKDLGKNNLIFLSQLSDKNIRTYYLCVSLTQSIWFIDRIKQFYSMQNIR